jgi:hydrogenase nickel incorporation protein HypA/HybF
MREQALIESVVETILTRLHGEGDPFAGTVSSVRLSVGELDLQSIVSFCRAFQASACGTPLEGVRVEVTLERARVECPDCGYEGRPRDEGRDAILPFAECPECGLPLTALGGRGISQIDVETDRVPVVSG